MLKSTRDGEVAGPVAFVDVKQRGGLDRAVRAEQEHVVLPARLATRVRRGGSYTTQLVDTQKYGRRHAYGDHLLQAQSWAVVATVVTVVVMSPMVVVSPVVVPAIVVFVAVMSAVVVPIAATIRRFHYPMGVTDRCNIGTASTDDPGSQQHSDGY